LCGENINCPPDRYLNIWIDWGSAVSDFFLSVVCFEKKKKHYQSIQGDHSPGKPGKVREFQSGQGKVRENGKSQGK